MPEQKKQWEDFLQFIKERRSDESHFGELYNKLNKIITTMQNNNGRNSDVIRQLEEAREKQAVAYEQVKEKNGTAWPEFEKFVTQLEKATTAVMNK